MGVTKLNREALKGGLATRRTDEQYRRKHDAIFKACGCVLGECKCKKEAKEVCMTENKPELKTCPICDEPVVIDGYKEGSCLDICCCVQMSLQKSDCLTMEERQTWVQDFDKQIYKFSDQAEDKALVEIVKRWNQRADLAKPSEWISVDDRLPEFEINVIVFRGSVDTCSEDLEIEYHNGKTFTAADGAENYPVTHWKPLPAPPVI